MDYVSTIEAGEKWGLSKRRVAILCSENRNEAPRLIKALISMILGCFGLF